MMTVLDIEQLYCNLFLSKLGGGCFILFLINIVEEKSGISLCFFAGNHFFLLLWCLCFLFFFLKWDIINLFSFLKSNLLFLSCDFKLGKSVFIPILSSGVYSSREFAFSFIHKVLTWILSKRQFGNSENILQFLEVKLFHRNAFTGILCGYFLLLTTSFYSIYYSIFSCILRSFSLCSLL